MKISPTLSWDCGMSAIEKAAINLFCTLQNDDQGIDDYHAQISEAISQLSCAICEIDPGLKIKTPLS